MFGDGLDPEEWGLEGTDFEHNGSEVEEGEPLPSLQHVSDQEAPGPAMPEDVDTGSGPPPTLASQSNRAFFESSFISNAKFCDIKLPWETGVAQQIFSDSVLTTPVTPMVGISDLEHVPPQHAVETVVDDTVSQTMIVQTSAVIYTSVVQNLDDKTYDEQRDSLMDAAICKLLIVLRHSLLASVVGRQIIALGSEQQQLEGASGIVAAVVGLRSPCTVVKRANSLLSFLRWCAKRGHVDANPFVEHIVWEYFCELKSSKAPATRAVSCLSAFRFAQHILGFESLSHVTASRRLSGLSEQLHAKKRMLKQALPLTVAQVKRLRDVAYDQGRNIVDRGAAVYFLLAIYGRCRHSE